MPRYKLKAEVTITYLYDIEAETLADAIARAEDDDDDSTELDSTAPVVTEYTIDGQMGWNLLERDRSDNPIIPEDVA